MQQDTPSCFHSALPRLFLPPPFLSHFMHFLISAAATDSHYLLQWIYSSDIMDHYLACQQLESQIAISLQSVSGHTTQDHYLPQ